MEYKTASLFQHVVSPWEDRHAPGFEAALTFEPAYKAPRFLRLWYTYKIAYINESSSQLMFLWSYIK
jgi:hypothetical protein